MKLVINYRKIVVSILFLVPIFSYANLQEGVAAFNEKRYEVSFPILLENAAKGNTYAQGLLAIQYVDGIGTQKNFNEAHRWASLGEKNNDANSLYVLGLLYQYGLGTQINTNLSIEFYKRAANLGVSAAIFRLGQIYAFTSDDNLRNFSLGEKYLIEALSKNNKDANKSLGYLYHLGGLNEAPNHIKALSYLEKAYEAQPDDKDVKKLLVTLYTSLLLGDGRFNNPDKNQISNAKIFIQSLLDKNDPYWYYYAIEDARGGYKRPFNTQLALELTMNGIKQSDPDVNEELTRIAYIIFNTKPFSDDRFLHYAWFYKNFNKDLTGADLYKNIKSFLVDTDKKMRSELSNKQIDEIRKISLNDLADLSINYLSERRKLIGNIEPSDLLLEGWKVFYGVDRNINEPLAQHLTEESLRLAIRSKNQEIIANARNNLGVILVSAINKNVKNERLAHVHMMDGIDSIYGPSNILWLDYRGKVRLSDIQKETLLKRYRQMASADHPASLLKPLTDSQKSDPRELDKLIQQFKQTNSDPVLAEAFAHFYEQNIDIFGIDKAIQSFQEAVEILQKNKQNNLGFRTLMFERDLKNRTEKLIRVKAGDYEKGSPDTSLQIAEIFKDLDTVRGFGKSVNEKSRITKNTLQNKSKLSLNALVIGNSSYRSKQLVNSTNDAKSIAEKLKKFGFNVMVANNLDRKSFIKTLLDFSERAKDSDVTVMYYAGHGVQLGGLNYLLPIDIDLNGSEEVVSYDGISLNEILRRNIPGKSRVIFLDACRTKPFKNSITRGSSDGLAPMNVATGTLISFATRDGGVAYDSDGSSNSPYTASLIKMLDRDDDIALLLREVRDEVIKKTNGKQEPWEYGALSSGRLVISRLLR
jgi:TPR repeat protein